MYNLNDNNNYSKKLNDNNYKLNTKKCLTSIEHSSFPQPCNFLIKWIYFPEQSDNNQGFQLVYASLPFKETKSWSQSKNYFNIY